MAVAFDLRHFRKSMKACHKKINKRKHCTGETASMSISTLRIGPAGPLAGQSSDGASESAASILRSALLSHYACASSSSSSSNDSNTTIMTIDNKYFTARVALTDLDLASGAPSEAGDAKEDGMILVFHDAVAGRAAPLDALASVHSAAEASNQAGDLLRLLVAVTTGPVPDKTTKAAEEEYSRRVLWCLDRGYEYVEADCSEVGLKAGHDEREKDGFARVAEAVGGTVWSSALNKPREQRGAAAALAKIEAELKEKEEQEGEKGKAESSEKAVTNTSEAKAEAQPTAADAFPVPPEPRRESSRNGDDGDNDGEDTFFFENLDSVMAQVRSISSQARSGALTDEERRMKASDAAVALMGALEKMGFDDDGSSSASGEQSSQEE